MKTEPQATNEAIRKTRGLNVPSGGDVKKHCVALVQLSLT